MSYLITFEGGEGSGKSTQSKMLFEFLNSNKIPAILTREPGGTETAEKIRNILLNSDEKISAEGQLLLHFAARKHHLENKILPALSEKKIVISDRFSDSTYAYQGYAGGVDLKKIEVLEKISINNFKPHLTFIFDIDPEIGMRRAKARASKANLEQDNYENLGLDFHQKVREGFLEIARSNPDRYFVLDAKETLEKLHNNVISILRAKSLILETSV